MSVPMVQQTIPTRISTSTMNNNSGPEVVHLEEFHTYTVPQGKTAWLRECIGRGHLVTNREAYLWVNGWPRDVFPMVLNDEVMYKAGYRYGIPFTEGTVLENFDTVEVFNFVILDN